MKCRTKRQKESPFKEQLDKMTWSFSRVNAYETCPKMFKMIYLDRDEDGNHIWSEAENAFGLWGTHCHECLERFYKDELLAFELLDAYQDGYDEAVYMRFPPNKYKDLGQSYYDAGVEYFANFENLPENWEVLGVEQRIDLELDGRKFVGYIDLVLRDKQTDSIVIVDHKSKAAFQSDAELEHYSYQPYLYSLWVKQRYGKFPDMLVFNMFRIGKIVRVPFEEEGLQKALQWFHDTVDRIYSDTKFDDKIKLDFHEKGKKLTEYKFADFFCHWICGVRFDCKRSKILKKRGDYYGLE